MSAKTVVPQKKIGEKLLRDEAAGRGKETKERREKRILPEKYPPKYTKEKATAEADAAHSGNLRSNHFWHDVMPGTEDVEKPVYRKEPVYATKYYYEIDKWTVVDTAKKVPAMIRTLLGRNRNLKDGQRTGAEEEHYFCDRYI